MPIPVNKLPCKNKKEIEINEEDIIAMMDKKIQEKTHGKAMEDMNLDELDELEDEVKNVFIKLYVQVKLFQNFSFLHQLTQNIIKIRSYYIHVEYMLNTIQVTYKAKCFTLFIFIFKFFTQYCSLNHFLICIKNNILFYKLDINNNRRFTTYFT